MSHSCRSLLCETPHDESHPDECSCTFCHEWHQDQGVENYQGISCCDDQISYEQELGIRCAHGNYIPYVADPRDKGRYSIITDRECSLCQIDYGPAMGWEQILERELQTLGGTK